MSTLPSDSSAREVDPFGFFIGHASAIKGLGGDTRGPDPTYAFHTPYMEYRPGPVVFTLRFDGLAAEFGELVIHVNSFVPGSGAHALLVTILRAPLVDLAGGDAMLTIRINALANVGYAIFGYFPDGAEARADGLSIVADELGTEDDLDLAGDAALPTRFGIAPLRHQAYLVSEQPPIFARPISQVMTASQIEEPAYRARLQALALDGRSPTADWKRAFVLQAVETYGFLAPGAHGLALADGESPLAAALIARGCPITVALATDDENATRLLTPRRYPALCDDALFDRAGTLRTVDPFALDEDLRGYDFLWSIDTACRLGSLAAGRDFIERSLQSLRPGGLAIHMFDMVLDNGDVDPPWDGIIPQRRVEAIALTLLSRSNEVSQLSFGGLRASPGPANGPVPFGLIVRRRGARRS